MVINKFLKKETAWYLPGTGHFGRSLPLREGDRSSLHRQRAKARRNKVGAVYQGWELNRQFILGASFLTTARSHPKPGQRAVCKQVGSRNPVATFSNAFI